MATKRHANGPANSCSEAPIGAREIYVREQSPLCLFVAKWFGGLSERGALQTSAFLGILFIVTATAAFAQAQQSGNALQTDPVKAQLKQQSGQNIFVADPFILEDNGVYYLYGTSSKDGIVVWRSADLVSWEGPCGATSGLALHKKDSWGERNFWAPEVYKINGRYVMTYSVEEHVAVAKSSSPLGPFIQAEKKPLLAEKGIDSHIFIDDDGTPHLYWVRFQGGNIIYTARMSRDLKSVDMRTARRCITPQKGTWERTDAEPRANVAEGPFVIKRGGKYYLSYSCNHFKSPDYAVGWAVADKPEGPWKRSKSNPMLLRHDGYIGTGHHAFLQTSAGKLYIVYHAHNSSKTISPRRTLIAECYWDPVSGFASVRPGSFELVKK